MFALTYLRRELFRRRGRTIVTVLGLAVGVALVVASASVASGLDHAQSKVLDPLASVGTDLLVTRPVEVANGQAAPDAKSSGTLQMTGASPASLGPEDLGKLLVENQSVFTDLSKLGQPGQKFVHDFFLPATQLTFPIQDAVTIARMPGVANAAPGLTLLGVHQDGSVPKIVAELKTSTHEISVNQQIAPPTDAERADIQKCMARPTTGTGLDAMLACLPDRYRRFQGVVKTAPQVLRQVLGGPQTDLRSEPYTVAGVELHGPGLGLMTPSQITVGRYFSTRPTTTKEVVLAEAYAQRKGMHVGSRYDLNGTSFDVVGLAKAPLGGQSADVYLVLRDLQQLSARTGRLNVLMVRAVNAGSVKALSQRIEHDLPGTRVTSAQDVANRVSGSLVDASRLAKRLGVMLSIVALIAAFLVAALLSVSSVSKRVRELGTLKALGWRQGRVVRQVVAESLVHGALGGIVGVVLGMGGAAIAAHVTPALEASAAPISPLGGVFGLGVAATAQHASVHITAPVHAGTAILAVGLALLGGVVAGAFAGMRAARLRPADALRELG